jgi:hypothetical protein
MTTILEFIKQSEINVEVEPSNTGDFKEIIALEDYSDEDGVSYYIACSDTKENVIFLRIFFLEDSYEVIQFDCVEAPVDYNAYDFTLLDTDVEKLTKEINKYV